MASLASTLKGSVSARLTPTIDAPLGKAHGNIEVLERLRGLVKKAEDGHTTALFYVLIESQKDAGYGFAGTHGSLAAGEKGVEILLAEIKNTLKCMASDDPDLGKDLSYHEYNLLSDPLNFDVLPWLINAELIRRRNNAPWPLRIGFSGYESIPEKYKPIVNNVHRSLLQLIGAVEDPAAVGGCRSARFTPSDVCAAARRGEAIPKLRPPDRTLQQVKNWLSQYAGDPRAQKKPVVITLREASHFAARNSNRDAFVKFARELRDKGELVIFVRDTERANEALEDFVTFPSASIALGLRMALYTCAKCNLFTSNGPGGLGLFSDVPYLYFLNLKSDPENPVNDPEWWSFANGITEGEQWPWANENQHMIWGLDDYPTISAAWEQYYGTEKM